MDSKIMQKNKQWCPASLEQQDNEQKEPHQQEQARTAATAHSSSLMKNITMKYTRTLTDEVNICLHWPQHSTIFPPCISLLLSIWKSNYGYSNSD